MFTSSGLLVYDPPPKTGTALGKWWLIAECCPDLARYYRDTFAWQYRARGLKLQRPSWDSHVSIIRCEEPPRYDLWRKWDGKVIEFRYDPELKTNDEYYWLDVECEEFLNIREELGLPRQPIFGLHLTIGRIT